MNYRSEDDSNIEYESCPSDGEIRQVVHATEWEDAVISIDKDNLSEKWVLLIAGVEIQLLNVFIFSQNNWRNCF